MSRSYKKTPILGYAAARSERRDKKGWHGRMRAAVREALLGEGEMPEVREVSNVWSFAKDGKRYYSEEYDEFFKESEKPHENTRRRKKFKERRQAQQGK